MRLMFDAAPPFVVSGKRRRSNRLAGTLDLPREIRARLEPRGPMEGNKRRQGDLFREEHHDAHAKTIKAEGVERKIDIGTSSAIVGSANPNHAPAAGPRLSLRMRVRVIKTPPAPMMDGFDVSCLRAEQIYDVDSRTGSYLVIAGYAVRADDDSETTKPRPE